ncbi:MAG: hypothetical protein M1536_02765 [Firmicutes bacterium]|nr:hypothetical protein [Bacillota bacterium]
MKKRQAGAVSTAVIVLIVLLIASWAFIGAFLFLKKAQSEEGPKKFVAAYMDALKNKDFNKVFEILDFNLDKNILDKIKELLANEEYLAWRINSYKITDVKVDGGFAKVSVEETDYKEFKGPAKEAEKFIKPGENIVKETFYLVKDDGKWAIDPCRSWINFKTFPLKAEDFQNIKGSEEEEAQKKMGAWINTIGFGQFFTVVASPSVAPVVAIGAAIAIPNFIKARGQAQFVACESNMKNIGTALEMYATDNFGRYPTSLSQLTPNYLKSIPTCPEAARDTYSSSYRSSVNPDAYTFCCSGSNHTREGVGENYPQYNSVQGLITGKQ